MAFSVFVNAWLQKRSYPTSTLLKIIQFFICKPTVRILDFTYKCEMITVLKLFCVATAE